MISKIPILTFHSIDTLGSVLSFHPKQFRKILANLRDKGYTSISLYDVCDWIDGRKSFDSPVFVITFDDGFENLYLNAFNILEEYGFRATIFVVSGYCGLKNDWPSQPRNIPIMPILTWEQVNEMSKSVFDIQAHSMHHSFLSQESLETIEKEITGSKKMIEDKTGKPVDFFAYPYGDYNDLAYNIVSANYKGACSVDLSFASINSNRYVLERIDMYYFSSSMTKSLFPSFAFNPYLKLRKFLRHLKSYV